MPTPSTCASGCPRTSASPSTCRTAPRTCTAASTAYARWRCRCPAARSSPIAGLTWVGVHPDSRRRGVLTAMMTDHLARTRDAGTAISALHASEAAIYGRFGYGLAVLTHQVDLGRGTTFTAPHLEDEVAGITTQLADDVRRRACAERMRACQLASAPDLPRHDHRLARLLLPPGARDRPRSCATRSHDASSSRAATARTSGSSACAASTSGATPDPPAPSRSARSAAARRRGWRSPAASSTST